MLADLPGVFATSERDQTLHVAVGPTSLGHHSLTFHYHCTIVLVTRISSKWQRHLENMKDTVYH